MARIGATSKIVFSEDKVSRENKIKSAAAHKNHNES